MEYPWTRFFHLGVVIPAFFPEARERKRTALDITRRLAGDPFFQALEVFGADDPRDREEMARVLRSSGKRLIFSGGAYCRRTQSNLHDLDPVRWERAVGNVKKIIDEAVLYGCQILYLMGFEAPPAEKREKARKRFAEALEVLGDYAAEKNPSDPLTLSVENFYIAQEDPFLIGPTLECARMLRDLRGKRPRLGLTFDTSHILQLQEDLHQTFSRVQDVVAHVHLSNCLIRDRSSPFYGDKHPPYGLPGSEIGIPELAGFFRTLRQQGTFSRVFPTGKPVLSLEVLTPAGRTPQDALEEAKDSLEKAWEEFAKTA